jgi:hypothetical protein
MRASKADRPVLTIANRENQTIGRSVDQPVSAITRFAVLKTIVADDCVNNEIDPARQRYAVFRPVNRVLRRIEISRLSYRQFVSRLVKPGNGAMT